MIIKFLTIIYLQIDLLLKGAIKFNKQINYLLYCFKDIEIESCLAY